MRFKRGFTLIEILIVVAIIGILAGIVFVNLAHAKYRTNYSKTVSDVESINQAVNIFKNLYGRYPIDSDPGHSGTGIPGEPGYGITKPDRIAQASSDQSTFAKIMTWPLSVCDNWMYDWDNWTDPVIDQVANTYRISLRSDAVGTGAIFFHCVSSDDTLCVGNGSAWVNGPNDHYEYGGGKEIITLPNKEITCKE